MGRLLLLTVILGCGAVAVTGAPITYTPFVNTASLAGTTGSLDFNFNPGPLVSQSAFVQILSFSSGGAVAGSPVLTGDASGSLPGTVTLGNETAFNDYFQQFTYGATLTFNLSLYGPALSAPDGVSSSGSTFAFSMFSDAAGTIPALTTDVADGFAYLVNVNLDGSTTATSYLANSVAAPEPTTWALIVIALLMVAAPATRLGRSARNHRLGRQSAIVSHISKA